MIFRRNNNIIDKLVGALLGPLAGFAGALFPPRGFSSGHVGHEKVDRGGVGELIPAHPALCRALWGF